MFELMVKKISTILHSNTLLMWIYDIISVLLRDNRSRGVDEREDSLTHESRPRER